MLSFSNDAKTLPSIAGLIHSNLLAMLKDHRISWEQMRHHFYSTQLLVPEHCLDFLELALKDGQLEISVRLLEILYAAPLTADNYQIFLQYRLHYRNAVLQLWRRCFSPERETHLWDWLAFFLVLITPPSQKAGPFFYDEDREALHVLLLGATTAGKLSIVKQILALGADCETRNVYQQTIVQVAFFHHQYDMVACLLSDYKADVYAQDMEGSTLLHMAVKGGDLPEMRTMIAYLLNCGLHPQCTDKQGRTPLMLGQDAGWDLEALTVLLGNFASRAKIKT